MLDYGLIMPASLPWRSSSATCCGLRHQVNEDSIVDLANAGVFVVADGVGGHTDGALASRSIAEIVRRVAYINSSLDAKVADIEAALHSVNAALHSEAKSRSGGVIIGSTVAALILDHHYAVCLWSGDSRIYLRRKDQLYQLTRDHTVDPDDDHPGGSGILTHAVGSADTLVLDRVVTAIHAGDTFLVCSDGVTKTLSDLDLEAMLADSIDGLAATVVTRAVDQGATDDVSAILIRCIETAA